MCRSHSTRQHRSGPDLGQYRDRIQHRAEPGQVGSAAGRAGQQRPDHLGDHRRDAYGTDQVGNAVSVTGSIGVSFGNFGDQ